MVIIRPVALADLDPLVELAGLAGAGLTTLPKDRQLLRQRIDKSLKSFSSEPDRPGGESYLFVMEDNFSGRVVGACGIVSKVGGFEPFYDYRIDKVVFESKLINVRKEVPILNLTAEHDGPCEIGSLFLHADYRGGGNGRFLQLVRFLFIAERPQCFESTVVSEIRGVVDDQGRSPFWDALGAHFFGIDFTEADRLSVVNKKFIADLMPRHPIYIPLLPKDAQDVIGKPHKDSVKAVENLQVEGFTYSPMVDIFDAGPVVSCARDDIRTIKQSRRERIAAVSEQPVDSPLYMIGTTRSDFRACKATIDTSGNDGLRITREAAQALRVGVGDAVRFVELQVRP
ncbi:MAG TPA: arginine N-succinyltransferase [Tepidisphaeraceae bacterium]|nr:arginine N-succinyltransferase [Tepidisphaeraceae bacterium]